MKSGLLKKARQLLCLLTLWPVLLHAADLDRIRELVGDGAVMLRSPSGEDILSINPDQPMIPASLLKIPMAQVAIEVLGEDYRFETRFYQNDDRDLLIRGLGDPFLISEEVAAIAEILYDKGLRQVHRLVVDDSAFESNPDLPLEPGADDPYAARNSALAVNFNTVNLNWNDDGELVSAEAQTPLTDVGRELGARLRVGDELRINLGNDPVTGLRQVQQVFRFFLEREGITVGDSDFYHEELSDEWAPYFFHPSSHTLRDNLQGMLRYSNNFIANQLFLTLGMESGERNGYPATAEAAREALQQELSRLYGNGFGDDPNTLLMIEGSGLGRNQRSSAQAMMQILESFEPHADLLPEVGGVLRKSGTLTGVYNFAGYLQKPDGLYPFVILTNQARNNRAEILRLLNNLK